MNKKSLNSHRKVKEIFKYLNFVLYIGVVIAAIKLGVKIHALKLLPVGYLFGLTVGMIFYFGLIWLGIRKRFTSVLLCIISCLLIWGMLFGERVVDKVDVTLNKLSTNVRLEVVDMAVYVKFDDSVTDISELKNVPIGLLSGDGLEEIKSKLEGGEAQKNLYTEYRDPGKLMDALLTGEERAAVMNSAYLDILSEVDGYENIEEQIRVLYMLSIEVEVADSTMQNQGNDQDEDDNHGQENNQDQNQDQNQDLNTSQDQNQENNPAYNRKDEPLYKLTSDEDTMVIYISGIDKWGAVNVRSRSDVNILAIINTKSAHIQLINTPRDYFVYLPNQGGMDKLTHAGLYGYDSSIRALEDLYGVDIDYFVRMNFSGFEAIVDALDGVDVYSAYDFTVEPIKHYTVGYNHVTGLEALAFARERYSFKAGDVQRGINQMEVIRAVIDKATSPAMIMNYNEVLDRVADCIQTDVSTQVIYDLVRYQMSTSVQWKIDSFTVTGTGSSQYTYSMPNTTCYVMFPNEADMEYAKKLIKDVLAEE